MLAKKIFMAAVLAMAVMVGVFQSNFAKAAEKAEIGYECTNVILSDGQCHIEGFFYNNTNKDIQITATRFYGTLNDLQGNVLYTIDFTIDSSVADLSQCIVPANGKIPGTFSLTPNEEPITYEGEFTYELTCETQWK